MASMSRFSQVPCWFPAASHRCARQDAAVTAAQIRGMEDDAGEAGPAAHAACDTHGAGLAVAVAGVAIAMAAEDC